MMKFIIPAMLLPLISNLTKTWTSTMLTIIVMTPLSITLIPTTTFSPNPSMTLTPVAAILITLSIWLTILMFLSSLAILNQPSHLPLFTTLTLTLLISLLITFSMNSILKFYIAFEATLIPTAMLIMYWGPQPERIPATTYMLMYTLTASIPLLMALLLILNNQSSLSTILPSTSMPINNKMALFMIGAFLVKLPIYTTHQWLPKAHVEAPVAGSMILAGVLLKLGAFGIFMMLNMNIMLTPLKQLLMSLSLIGATMTALLCLRQNDIKALIAYASVSHMSLMLTALLHQSLFSIQASIMMLIAHGLTSSGLFAAMNMIYESYKTRNLYSIKSILAHSPILSLSWFMLLASNMGAPPFINLPAEMLIVATIVSLWFWPFLILTPALILFTSAYSLNLFTTSIHGSTLPSTNTFTLNTHRNNLINMAHLAPLVMIMLTLPTLTN